MAQLSISVVIPVFNEEAAIVPCLEALFAQEVLPDEIIVVDNGSTDATQQQLLAYKGKITLLDEPRSGVVFARTTGFNAAKGDIIARIDADSRVDKGWIKEIHTFFSHSKAAAVSGGITYYDLPLQKLAKRIDAFTRHLAMGNAEDAALLHGTNMAIRREVWLKIRNELCIRNGIHEDLDIAAHLRRHNYMVAFDSRLMAAISARRLDDSIPEMYRYALGNIKTYETHKVRRMRGALLVASALIVFHLPLRAIHRGYDPVRKRFSIKNMVFARPVPRKSPLN